MQRWNVQLGREDGFRQSKLLGSYPLFLDPTPKMSLYWLAFLLSSDANIFAHVRVKNNLLKFESSPRLACVQPGGVGNRAILGRTGDPENFVLIVGSFEAHDFHGIHQAGLRIEAYDKVFHLVFERDE
jgi:hypothetical protein